MMRSLWVVPFLAFAFAACGSDSSSGSATSTDACGSLCSGAGFSGGKATDFGKGLVECVCSGTGKGIAKASCENYCKAYNVSADKSLLSKQASDNDKCVCDGTTAPGH